MWPFYAFLGAVHFSYFSFFYQPSFFIIFAGHILEKQGMPDFVATGSNRISENLMLYIAVLVNLCRALYSKWQSEYIHPFQPSVAFLIETSLNMKWKTEFKWVTRGFLQHKNRSVELTLFSTL